jgi:flagella basal body P-ring formation protein FlgA
VDQLDMRVTARFFFGLLGGTRRITVGILTLAAALLTLSAGAAEWQSPESVRAAARDYVARTAGSAVRVEAAAVDDRLKLPACSEPLVATAQSALRNGQGTVAVSCAGAQPWRLYVPVRTATDVGVLVVQRDVAAGERLTVADLAVVERPSGSLPYQYFTAVEQAVGHVVRRTLPAGTVLVPAAVDTPRVVERGALVTLVAGGGAVAVRAEGVALESAGVDERVRVRSASGRVIEGVVAASGEVQVGAR